MKLEGDLGIINQGYLLTQAGFDSLKSIITGDVVVNEKQPMDFEGDNPLRFVRIGREKECENVLKIDTPSESDLWSLGEGVKTLITMPHRQISSLVEKYAKELNVRVFALEEALTSCGQRAVHCLHLTGECGAYEGVEKFRNENGCTASNIALLGFGSIAVGAAKYLNSNGFEFTCYGRGGRWRLQDSIEDWDIIINGINWPMDLRCKEYWLEEKHVSKMIPGSIIVDLDVDFKGMGPIETCEATTAENPWYLRNGVWHACVWGWPQMDLESAGRAYFKMVGDAFRNDLVP